MTKVTLKTVTVLNDTDIHITINIRYVICHTQTYICLVTYCILLPALKNSLFNLAFTQ